MKKKPQRAMFVVLLMLLGLALAGVFLTDNGADPSQPRKSPKRQAGSPAASAESASLTVDERPLQTAQRFAPLVAIPEEQDFARTAIRVGDHEVDLAFASAMRAATLHPPPLTPEAKTLAARVREIQQRMAAEQNDIAHWKHLLEKSPESKKESVEQQLELVQAQLDLDQDELDDAHQDLIGAGGDPASVIRRLLADHEASLQHQSGAGSRASRGTHEATQSRSALARFLAWREWNAKEQQLLRAREESKTMADELASRHEALEQEARVAGIPAPAPQAPAAQKPGESAAAGSHAARLSGLQQRKEFQKSLAETDKRVQDLQELTAVYGNWATLARSRAGFYLNGLLWCAVWILLICLLTLLADPFLHRLYERLAPGYKRLHTLRTMIRFVLRAAGVLLILLVLFGPPSQLGTFLALTGAGLTLALRNFIVGFFGWFVLMGRNGIHPGDWVEINGIGGEVLEVGLLHTVLLETGNWSDSGHPTGRKVTFVNSFAIEGHYFNFSTAGQWLWDELQVLLPAAADPYATAEEVQKIAVAETQENARLAEQEWQRVVPAQGQRGFSAEPVMSIRPGNFGVTVFLRYITRAQERHEVRSRLYREIVELLHRKQAP